MKKIIIILISILLFLPLNIKAVEIRGASFSTSENVEIGGRYKVNVKPSIGGFTPGYNNTLGYLIVYVEIIFDEDVLILENVEIPHFKVNYSADTRIEENHYLVYGIFDDEDASDVCGYGSLYCGDLSVDISFFARNTEYAETKFEIRNITLIYLDMIDKTEEELESMTEEELQNYLLSNIKSTYKDVQISKTIPIKKNNSAPIVNEPTIAPSGPTLPPLKPIVVPKVETPQKPTSSTENNTSKNLSSNTFLSKLEIYNYNIDFNKKNKYYEISVSPEVNELDVRASVEDEKALYKIYGNDDLKNNDYTVTIEVTAEDNTKSTYKIKVNLKDEENQIINDTTPKEEKKKDIKLDKKIIKLMSGIGIGLLLIIVLIIIKSIRKKKTLDKMFKEL